MQSNEVAIIIPFHNSVHWLELCLRNIINLGIANDYKCIVVNDRSDQPEVDKALEFIKPYKNRIQFVNTENEAGYGATCNYGISLLDSKYALLLNTDCLITKTTIQKLQHPHMCEDNVLMTCPISNNSPNYTYDLPNGLSFIDVDRFLTKVISLGDDGVKSYSHAHTIVGNCLLVNVNNFRRLDGFSASWGIGYGEETDLQYRGEREGMLSLVAYNSYVYHYGGGSFNNLKNIDVHKDANYKRFLSIWGAKYFYEDTLPRFNVLDFINKVFSCYEISVHSKYDILFYLPIINQQIGGIHSIIDICNELILAGFSANCVLIGNDCESQYKSYMEYMVFKPLYFSTDEAFINECEKINFERIVSTAHNSAVTCHKISRIKNILHIQYVQGVEYLFDNGLSYRRAIESYDYGSTIVFASHFLRNKIGSLFKNKPKFHVINPKINTAIFYERYAKKHFFLGFCLRLVQDKGQLYLLNLLQNGRLADKKICIFGASAYKSLFVDSENITFIELPISKSDIAIHLSQIENYIDMSLHEGYGLMAFEALLCGCRVLSTNSGGVTDYIELDEFCLIENPLDDSAIVDKLFDITWRNKIKNLEYDCWSDMANV